MEELDLDQAFDMATPVAPTPVAPVRGGSLSSNSGGGLTPIHNMNSSSSSSAVDNTPTSLPNLHVEDHVASLLGTTGTGGGHNAETKTPSKVVAAAVRNSSNKCSDTPIGELNLQQFL